MLALREYILILKNRIEKMKDLNKDHPLGNAGIFESLDEILDELKKRYNYKQ